MNFKIFYMAISAIALCTQCQTNASDKKDNGLQEVRIDDKVSNADIVRLPVTANEKFDSTRMARIKFDTNSINFGSITEGSIVKKIFKLKNVGTVPLIIADIQTTCGCTVADWSRNAIQVGASSEIQVSFNATGKEGVQDKPIRVIGNTMPSETVLTMTGTVLPRK